MSEQNPCNVVARGPDGAPLTFSPGEMKQLGETCSGTSQCYGHGGSIYCISYETNATSGTCTDLAGVNNPQIVQVVGAPGGNALLADVIGVVGGMQFVIPNCNVGNGCGFVAGDEAACANVGGLDGDTCASQVARRDCLQQTAQAQCVGGVLVPVPIGAEWRCTTPGQPDKCGPAGAWFCKCPNDPDPPLWTEQFRQCGTKCGDGNVDAGEECDDGNQVNNDECTNTCKKPVGGECKNVPDACGNGAADLCKQGEKCENTAAFPCAKCVPVVGGQCKGNECEIAEAAGAVPPGKECSLTGQFPCVTWVGPFACGNGEIDPPTEVDEGCKVTGTSGQICAPENMVIDDFGRFHPSHQCYMGAHCKNTNGQCAWEMTQDLAQCLQENNAQDAQLPDGCFCDGNRLRPGCPFNFVQDPCAQLFDAALWRRPIADGPAGSPLLAQAGDQEDRCIVTMDIRWCCDGQGQRIGWQSRTCPNNAWGPCNAGTVENCSIVPGTNCQPWVCPDGRTFPSCQNGSPINYVQNPCNGQTPRCTRGGCFGELCVPEFTTPPVQCDIVQNVACYQNAECRWQGSSCGWTMTPELQRCLNDNAASGCASDQSCLSRAACQEQGGSAGGACGAGDASVCCSGVITDEPVEQCDDGNQIDDDACGNDCNINCKKNADCPDGACVNGECVKQCVMPNAGAAQAVQPRVHAVGVWNDFLSRFMAQELAGRFTLLP